MRAFSWIVSGVASGAFLLAACADEDPVAVGEELIPGLEIVTIDTVLDAAAYLELDTTFGGYALPSQAPFVMIAEDWQGVLDAHALVRFGRRPQSIVYRDEEGVLQSDTTPTFHGGQVVLTIDTIRSEVAGPVRLMLFDIAEEWDPATATWTLRIDSVGVQEAWTEPGGTRGALVDSVTIAAGQDSVIFDVDSATAHRWTDTTDFRRSALVVAETPGALVRTQSATVPFLLRLLARPTERPDTVVTAAAPMLASTFIYDPPQPGPDGLRVGGLPSNRGVLRFRDDFGDIVLRCEPDRPCIRIRDAQLSRVALLLETRAVAAPFQPEDSLLINAQVLIPTALAPLERFPVGDTVGITRPIGPESFGAAAPDTFSLAVTRFAAALAVDTSSTPLDVIGLISRTRGGSEAATFGFGAFEPGPRLRVIATYARPEETP